MKHFELGWGDWLILVIILLLWGWSTHKSWSNRYRPMNYQPTTAS